MSIKLTWHVNNVINTIKEACYQSMKNLSLGTTLFNEFHAPRSDYGSSCRWPYITLHCQALLQVFIENFINLAKGQQICDIALAPHSFLCYHQFTRETA